MTSQEVIERIKDDDVPIEEVFSEMLEFFEQTSDKELANFLVELREKIDVDNYVHRLEQIGDMGALSDDYKKHMIRAFVYADKNQIL